MPASIFDFENIRRRMAELNGERPTTAPEKVTVTLDNAVEAAAAACLKQLITDLCPSSDFTVTYTDNSGYRQHIVIPRNQSLMAPAQRQRREKIEAAISEKRERFNAAVQAIADDPEGYLSKRFVVHHHNMTIRDRQSDPDLDAVGTVLKLWRRYVRSHPGVRGPIEAKES